MIREWVAAVAALDWADDHRNVKVNVCDTILLSRTSRAEEQKRFYKSLLELPWLAPKVRYAIMRELGLSKREVNRGIEHARATTIYLLVEEEKVRLRQKGERPHGGVHTAAVTEVADRLGISPKGLENRLERNGPTAAERRLLKDQAKRNLTDKF